MTETPFFAANYARPDLQSLTGQTQEFVRQCAEARSAHEFVATLKAWNRCRAAVDTNMNVAMVRYHQNTQDHAAKNEQDFWNEAAPTLRELDVLHARAVIESPYRSALDADLGPQFSELKTFASTTFAPEIKEALGDEAKLVTRYTEVAAKPEIEFRGKKLNMSGIAKYFSDADRQTRLEAQQARGAFLAANCQELDSIFDRLVELRHGMGQALGHENFIPLGYTLMSRRYTANDVQVFRDALCAEIVPLADQLHQIQRDRLGVDTLLFHDETVWDLRGNPRPQGGADFILARAREMYHELGSEFGNFIDAMLERKLLDVDTRDGKAGGGFCTHFNDLGLPFVFANFNGTDDDLMVITHECGHAFQAYSSRNQPVMEYVFPTYEAAEVHSMGMEFLTYPWMERFFGDDAERYRQIHLERIITFLPYIAAVDHFQHRIYQEPDLTPAQRHQLWLQMEERYLPHRRYEDLFPHVSKGTIWQRQGHIYQVPFYYIDYALAQVCALQIWRKAETDRSGAIGDYLDMCKVGGSLSFLEMLDVGKLQSPFDPDCIKEVARHARSKIADL